MTAGILKVPYLRFLLVDAICAVFVISMFFGLTYFFGKEIWEWIQRAESVITVAVVAAVIIGALFYWLHRRSKRMLDQAHAELPSEETVTSPAITAEKSAKPEATANSNAEATEKTSSPAPQATSKEETRA